MKKRVVCALLALALMIGAVSAACTAFASESSRGGSEPASVPLPQVSQKPDNSWYKDLTIYQIWCRSFKDSDGDGIGDLNGVYQKLDYLKDLGVDCIWFSPIYPSPQKDYGYDIADYFGINPEYGTMEDFQKVLKGAHDRGMKVIMDLVINHTSDQCKWFQESRKSKTNPYHDWYFWRVGKNGGNPNNWDSLFEGKAWKYDKDLNQYYLHIFSEGQPDLNMDNPEVRAEVKKIMRYWLNMGVDGFRVDVISYISKDEGLPDGIPLPAATGIEHYDKGPHLDEYLKEFKDDVYDHYNMFTVGEMPMSTTNDALKYGCGKRLDMLISFDHMTADGIFTDYIHVPFSLVRYKQALGRWQKALYGKGWNALYIENHDHARVISRYGSEKYWKQSGKTLAVSYLCLTGTPFIYQGQEIGMLNTKFHSMDECKDVVAHNNEKQFAKIGITGDRYLELLDMTSRENSRTPVQWDGSSNAGFTTGTPWFAVNPNYTTINVAAEENDPDSILNFYKKALKVRKASPALKEGSYREFYPASGKLFCYEKEYGGQKALIICSFSENDQNFIAPDGYDLTKGQLVLQNYSDAPANRKSCTLRPYECRVYLYN